MLRLSLSLGYYPGAALNAQPCAVPSCMARPMHGTTPGRARPSGVLLLPLHGMELLLSPHHPDLRHPLPTPAPLPPAWGGPSASASLSTQLWLCWGSREGCQRAQGGLTPHGPHAQVTVPDRSPPSSRQSTGRGQTGHAELPAWPWWLFPCFEGDPTLHPRTAELPPSPGHRAASGSASGCSHLCQLASCVARCVTSCATSQHCSPASSSFSCCACSRAAACAWQQQASCSSRVCSQPLACKGEEEEGEGEEGRGRGRGKRKGEGKRGKGRGERERKRERKRGKGKGRGRGKGKGKQNGKGKRKNKGKGKGERRGERGKRKGAGEGGR